MNTGGEELGLLRSREDHKTKERRRKNGEWEGVVEKMKRQICIGREEEQASESERRRRGRSPAVVGCTSLLLRKI